MQLKNSNFLKAKLKQAQLRLGLFLSTYAKPLPRTNSLYAAPHTTCIIRRIQYSSSISVLIVPHSVLKPR